MVPFRCRAWPTPSVIETVLVKVEKQGLDQQFYSHTHLWNSWIVAVVAGHSPCLGLDLSPFVDLEKQGLDQPFYSHTYHWNSGMVAVVAGHFLVC
ncbi:hypothetical protein OUZ56_019186 [Daphnia magna]|uniref:Uncharacterized protein n=1 Tax=Daphnia magna TaxID=35525 RepID=A0ABQ9ZAV7_9CRUS|nr:hypothetical protein OUZ56_019186 [Daphnia magna]